MLDIVFSDSALGSLKQAQNFGKGPYRQGCVGVFLLHEDGSQPTQAEIEAAQQEAEARQRQEWEQGQPMGGSPADVYGFSLALSIGDISEDIPGPLRQKSLDWLYSIYPMDPDEPAASMLERCGRTLQEIRQRAGAGEDLRLWYSGNPDEQCGLYWLLSRLPERHGQISLVKLPEWEARDGGVLVRHTGWGEIGPGEWRRYLSLQKPAPPVFCQSCAAHWKMLQKENAPLRAVINGQLASVPEDLYDGFLLRELEAEDETFQEARLIGSVLGKYQLGIGDAWLAHRIEHMLRAGSLEAVTEPPKDAPVYHRILRKT